MILLDTTFWEIKETKNKGKGVFATKIIEAGTVIADYIGKAINIAEEDTSEKDGLYLLYYNDSTALYPEDLHAPGAHRINHSCTPNSWIHTYKGHTLFFALRKIFPGEEITISYQLSPDDYCNPCTHKCICGSEFCTGTMHLTQKEFATWNTFSENESKETKRANITYGEILPRLKNYPREINDNPIYTLFGNDTLKPMVLEVKKIPSVKTLRTLIRSTGTTIVLPHAGIKIYGIKNNKIIAYPL